jgi:four helix bundle protein
LQTSDWIAGFETILSQLPDSRRIRVGTSRANRTGMNPKAEFLKARTKRFALDVLGFIDEWARRPSNDHIACQLCKAATSVGANYRAACRGRSKAEFAAKIGVVLEEADESLFWLEIADERNTVRHSLGSGSR